MTKTIRRLAVYLFRQKLRLLIELICIIAGSLFAVASPKVLGMAINEIYNGVSNALQTGAEFRVDFHTMGLILAVLLGLYLLEALLSYIRELNMASVSQTLILELRKEISAKFARLPISYFDRNQRGDVLSRVTNDTEKIADTLQESFTKLMSSVIGIIGAFIMMILISPMLTLISLVTIVLSIIVSAVVSSGTGKAYTASQNALGKLNASVEESFAGNLVIKAYGLEAARTEETEKLNKEFSSANSSAMFMTYLVNPLVRLVNHFGYVIIAAKGAMQVINGTISIGDIQAFIQYMNQISEPITELSYTFNALQGAVASAERIFDLLDEKEEDADPSSPLLPDRIEGAICFDHVRFGYSDDKILMEDVNIDIKAGSKVAIVGPTGAGKTTLVNLLMRFYDLKGGRIEMDGTDIVDMGRGELRSFLGMVLQESWLFEGTVRENIAYGRWDATDEDVYAAAAAARADHFIRTLPQGYDTVIKEAASDLSQGQRQLLTIARAIVADPLVLILDEATSSVDTRTELEIQKAMDELMKGRTSFVIAHRLSTIRDADFILVMNKGTIIEQGTHTELMKKNGFYADLYNSQFA